MDVRSGRLLGPDGEIVLRRQAWSLLRELVEQAPALIGRDELLDRVWGREALSPNALPQTISEVRQALGDSAQQPRYVETVRGRGYRMACPVKVDVRAPEPTQDDAAMAGPVSGRKPAWAMAAVALAAVGLLGWGLWAGLGTSASNDDATTAASAAPQAAEGQLASERLRRQAERATAEHDVLGAVAHWRALAAIHPNSIDVLIELARAELDALQGARARETLERIEQLLSGRAHDRFALLSAELALLDGRLEAAAERLEGLFEQAMREGDADFGVRVVLLLAEHARRDGRIAAGRERVQQMVDSEGWALNRQQRGRLLLEATILALEEGRLGLAETLAGEVENTEPNPPLRQRLKVELARLDTLRGRPEQALRTLEWLAEASERPRDPDFEIALINATGLAAIEAGRVGEAREHFDRAHALARERGNALRSAQLQVNAGLALARQNRMEEADALWTRSLEVFEAAGDRRGQATCLGNLAASASTRGLNARAREFNQQALALFRTLNLAGDRARTAFNLALLAARAGELDEAEALLAESESVYRDKDNHDLALHVGTVRAEQRVLTGEFAQAGRLLADLEALLEQASVARQAGFYTASGRLALARGQLTRARQAFEQALDLRRRSGAEDWVRASKLDLLRLALLSGEDPWQVRVEASEHARWFEEARQWRDAAGAWLLAAEALLGVDETEQARALIGRAADRMQRFEDVAVEFELEWVRTWAAPPAERSARLEVLADRAARLGFGKFVRRVQASSEPGPAVPEAARSVGRAVLPPYVLKNLAES